MQFLYVVIRDISKRRQYLEELQVSESRFRALFEENPLGIAYHQLLYDGDNSPIDYIYLDHNRRFSEMTRFGIDLTGKTILEIRPDFFTQYDDWFSILNGCHSCGRNSDIFQFIYHMGRPGFIIKQPY